MANSLAQTLSFAESGNSFESPLSFHPENMCFVGNTFVTFSGGEIYTHDDNVHYNRFYGIDYPSFIKVVFNQNPTIKKSFVAVTEEASTIWACPEIETQIKSYGNVPQQSSLVEESFEDEEGQYNAALRMDSNSIGGIINGDDLKGKYCIIKFYVGNATNLVILTYAQLKSIESALNSK